MKEKYANWVKKLLSLEKLFGEIHPQKDVLIFWLSLCDHVLVLCLSPSLSNMHDRAPPFNDPRMLMTLLRSSKGFENMNKFGGSLD